MTGGEYATENHFTFDLRIGQRHLKNGRSEECAVYDFHFIYIIGQRRSNKGSNENM